jgi:uncharacterized protein YqiB (DUF1249 family)
VSHSKSDFGAKVKILAFFEMGKQQLDLARLHDECERNYRRLLKVPLNAMQLGASAQLSSPRAPNVGLHIEVTEVTKYTSTLTITADRAGPDWIPQIEIKARVYRDAKMLEVIEWCADRTIPWVLAEQKPNQARDEKWQWNIFLSELLIYGLRHGAAVTEV